MSATRSTIWTASAPPWHAARLPGRGRGAVAAQVVAGYVDAGNLRMVLREAACAPNL